MMGFITGFLTPALVASLFSLLFNSRAEKRRDLRQSLLDSFTEVRKIVNDAVKAASEYYSASIKDRTPSLEAAIWLNERELRFALSTLMSKSDQSLANHVGMLQDSFDIFISELTGGNFQSSDADSDLKQVRKIAGLGAELRHALSNEYHFELKRSLSDDWLDKLINFLNKPSGISSTDEYLLK